MSDYVKQLTAIGLFRRLNLHQEFESGVNILYGRNGAGKTTILHILSNILNGDFERFLFLKFDFIELTLSTGTKIALTTALAVITFQDAETQTH
jgi:ATPase involved in DNA repair